MISGINVQTTTVTVEWFEKGETKGKEIDYEQLLGLNPSLLTFAENETENHHPITHNSVSNSRERIISDEDSKKKVISSAGLKEFMNFFQ